MEDILSSIAPNLNTESHFSAESLAEQVLIQSILKFPDSLLDYGVHEGLFKHAYYRAIFKIINEVRIDGAPITLTYLQVRFKDYFAVAGFREFFAEIWKQRDVKLNSNLKYYVGILQEQELRDKFEQLKWRTSQKSEKIENQITTLVEESHKLLVQYVPKPIEDFSTIFGKLIDKATLYLDGVKPFSLITNYEKLDVILGEGILQDYLIILGGLSGTGKTTFALNVAKNIALYQKHSVMYISLEMDSERILRWYLSTGSGVPVGVYFKDGLSDAQYTKLSAFISQLKPDPLIIYPCKQDLISIVTGIRQTLKIYPDCKMIIIDHLHFITVANLVNSTDIISRVTGTLKQLARELNVPILLLSQLTKPTKESFDMAPHLGMLKGSGSIISDADLIMILKYNPNKYLGENLKAIENYVLKNRGGMANCDPILFCHYASSAVMKEV